MRMWKAFILAMFLVVTLVGCGKAPQIVVSPAQVSLSQGTPIQVTLADNNYDGVTITIAGFDITKAGYQCQGGNGTYFQCSRYYGQNSGSFGGQNCSSQNPCQTVFIVTRGSNQAVGVVTVTQ